MESKHPSLWSAKDVSDWLESIELGQYKRNFESLGIDGALLFEIKDQDLDGDMGIRIRLHRVKILESIKKLKTSQPQPVVARPPPAVAEPEHEESEDEEQAQVHAIRLPDQSDSSASSVPASEILVLKAVEGLLLNNIYIVGSAGATLGRHTASNDIVVSESFVSRRHCDVKYLPAANRFALKDVGSTTGTFLMLQHPTPLSPSLMFQMGLSEFKAKSIKHAPPCLELDIFEGPAKHTIIKVGPEEFTIGRDPENAFSVREDSQMSSHHGRIYVEDGEFMLEDVGSTNKTWLRLSEEGVSSRDTLLSIGDVIKVGTTVLTVLPPDMSHYQSPVQPALSQQADSSPLPSDEPIDMSKSIPDDKVCKICFTRETDCALYPCGHMYCRQCSIMKKCHICRKNVTDVVKLFRQ